jgi:hypothetical protein
MTPRNLDLAQRAVVGRNYDYGLVRRVRLLQCVDHRLDAHYAGFRILIA